jgi:hypothetical protein
MMVVMQREVTQSAKSNENDVTESGRGIRTMNMMRWKEAACRPQGNA